MNREHGEVDYYLTQMHSGHGCFRAYLFRFGHQKSPDCPAGYGIPEDAEHVFFWCLRFKTQREELGEVMGEIPSPDKLTNKMLASEENWAATCSFAATVFEILRTEERERKANANKPATS